MLKKLSILAGLLVLLIICPVSATDYGETASPSFYTTVAELQPLDSFNMGSLNAGCVKIHYMDNSLTSTKMNDWVNTSWAYNKSQTRYISYSIRSDAYELGARKVALIWTVGACPNPWTSGGTVGKWWNLSDTYYSAPLNGNFTGNPVDGYSPLAVTFTAINVTNTTSIQWTFGDGQTADVNSTTTIHTYENPGIYTVSMKYWNVSGSTETITKPDYVLASVPSGLAVNLDIKNAITGVLVQDSTVGIRNTSSGVWRNTTAPTGLVYFTSTDPGYLYPLSQNQSITLAANKSGYQDASTTFNIPYNNYRSILYMMPTSIINATGNGTVVVNVIRALNGLTVSGMSVALDTGHVGITNTAGAVTLFNVTAGERTASVTDPDGAYLPTEKAFVLSAGETKLVTVYVARDDDPPIDPDDPFTSPTPTPTRTYDPNDPSSPVYGNYTTSEINQQGGAGVLAMLAQLIALWPAIVVFAFLKFMRSAMS